MSGEAWNFLRFLVFVLILVPNYSVSREIIEFSNFIIFFKLEMFVQLFCKEHMLQLPTLSMTKQAKKQKGHHGNNIIAGSNLKYILKK